MAVAAQQPKVGSGYRETDVGVIPEEWETADLGDLLRNGPTNGWSGRTNNDTTGTPTLSLAATTSGRLVLNEDTVKYLVNPIPKGLDLYLIPGDILVQRSNTIELVGMTAVFDGPLDVFVYPDLIMRLRFKDSVTGQWFWRYANSAPGRTYFRRVAAGSTGSMPKISGAKLREMPIPMPPRSEQEAITAALSDVDALVASLDQLIAKKCGLKQATMQQLLTGKQRLPGFSGKWEVKQLGSLGTFRGGTGFPTRYQGDIEGDYPFFKVSDMNNPENSTFMISSNNWISANTKKQMAANTFPANTIVFAKIGAAIFLERKKILFQDSCLDNNMMGFILDEGVISHRFVHYLLLNTQLGKLVAATALPSLNGKAVAALTCGIPELREQQAIAAVLSDMDADIAALEARRDKTRALKQGMMQELLTGKTRLI